VNLPAKLFLNTQIPASLWFMSRNRRNGKFRNRSKEILFIDARNMGHLINRRTRVLSNGSEDPKDNDIKVIADTYHHWRNLNGQYKDVKGFCKAAPIERVIELDYVLTPGRYVGLAEVEDDFDFKERFSSLKGAFETQLQEAAVLNKRIADNLAKINIDE
jgi:type I restriction enzyme M protein